MEFDREVFDLMPSGSKTFNLIGLKMPSDKDMNEARFSNIFIEKRASSCSQSLEKSRLFSYPLLMSEGENSQNVKRIFLRKVVI